MDKGPTQQPVIAERQLIQVGTNDSLTIHIHQPELGGAVPDWPWRCGFALLGLSAMPAFYGPESALADGDVWFADGQDSFDALMVALLYVRGMIDRVEEEFGVTYAWPVRADWGHMVPHWVTLTYGRAHEQRLLNVMEQEETRLIETRMPNPYAWDDPRHPSEIARRALERRKRRELE